MTRPTKAESEELERLERAAGLIARDLELLAVVALRWDQVLRRCPRFRELIEAGQGQTALVVRDLDTAHGLLREVLEARQAVRTAEHLERVEVKG